MDHSERQRLKQLAVDSIIETFGTDCPEQRLAEALEKCVDELELYGQRDECAACDQCEIHGGLIEE